MTFLIVFLLFLNSIPGSFVKFSKKKDKSKFDAKTFHFEWTHVVLIKKSRTHENIVLLLKIFLRFSFFLLFNNIFVEIQ
jgi:hypothetical protein